MKLLMSPKTKIIQKVQKMFNWLFYVTVKTTIYYRYLFPFKEKISQISIRVYFWIGSCILRQGAKCWTRLIVIFFHFISPLPFPCKENDLPLIINFCAYHLHVTHHVIITFQVNTSLLFVRIKTPRSILITEHTKKENQYIFSVFAG